MKLTGFNGHHLLGFMASIGLVQLLHWRWLEQGRKGVVPRLSFERDGCAWIHSASKTHSALAAALIEQIAREGKQLAGPLGSASRPADLTRDQLRAFAAESTSMAAAWAAALATTIGDETIPTSLSAANGAGHQNLLTSMRDMLTAVTVENMSRTLAGFWRCEDEFEKRKPTLRFDPGDDRVHALRAKDPTDRSEVYRTEIAAQALAAFAFPIFPVCPRGRRAVAVSSRLDGARVWFYWVLWDAPADVPTIRSLLWSQVGESVGMQERGAFTGLRCARVTQEKGKMSFLPSEAVW